MGITCFISDTILHERTVSSSQRTVHMVGSSRGAVAELLSTTVPSYQSNLNTNTQDSTVITSCCCTCAWSCCWRSCGMVGVRLTSNLESSRTSSIIKTTEPVIGCNIDEHYLIFRTCFCLKTSISIAIPNLFWYQIVKFILRVITLLHDNHGLFSADLYTHNLQ